MSFTIKHLIFKDLVTFGFLCFKIELYWKKINLNMVLLYCVISKYLIKNMKINEFKRGGLFISVFIKILSNYIIKKRYTAFKGFK